VTAICLNLLAEQQLAQQAHARDPLKTVTAICAALLTIVVGTGSVIYVIAGQKRIEAALLRAHYESLSSTETSDSAAEFKSYKSFADDIVAINHMRPLYAGQLALIKDLVPDSIQLARMDFRMTVEASDPATASQSAGGDDGVPAQPKHHAAPKNSSHLLLQLEGKAVSRRPEIEVDNFLEKLRTDVNMKERIKQVQLRSIARSSSSSPDDTSLPSAVFVIECQYKELN